MSDPELFEFRVKKDNLPSCRLSDYYEDVKGYWRDNHSQQHTFEVWLRVVDSSAHLAEAVRKDKMKEVVTYVADTFIWLLSFIAKMESVGGMDINSREAHSRAKRQMDSPLCDPLWVMASTWNPWAIIWDKYPGVCPACLEYGILAYAIDIPAALSENRDVKDIRDVNMSKFRRMGEWSIEDLNQLTTNIKSIGKKDLVRSIGHWLRTWNSPIIGKALDTPSSTALADVRAYPCSCSSRMRWVESRNKAFVRCKAAIEDMRGEYAAERRLTIEPTLEGIDSMFMTLFEAKYDDMSVESIAFHLLEEVGEAAYAIRDCLCLNPGQYEEERGQDLLRRRRFQLKEELADVFSWLWALVAKVRITYVQDSLKILDELASWGTSTVRMSTILKKALANPDGGTRKITDPEMIPNMASFIHARYSDPEPERKGWLFCTVCRGGDNNRCTGHAAETMKGARDAAAKLGGSKEPSSGT